MRQHGGPSGSVEAEEPVQAWPKSREVDAKHLTNCATVAPSHSDWPDRDVAQAQNRLQYQKTIHHSSLLVASDYLQTFNLVIAA
jgi:hypothetical protein